MPADGSSHRDKKLVYHLTHATNLPSIAQHGLLSRREMDARGLRFTDVADSDILDGRADYGLDAHVPFHFIPQSPFDCAVVQAASDKRFVLVAVYRSSARAQGWKVIPRHPLADGGVPDICEWDEGLDKIDWAEMDRYPRPYDSDHHCKMVCMAEALGPNIVVPSEFFGIFAPNDAVLQAVQANFRGSAIRTSTNPSMFPTGCR